MLEKYINREGEMEEKKSYEDREKLTDRRKERDKKKQGKQREVFKKKLREREKTKTIKMSKEICQENRRGKSKKNNNGKTHE